MRLGYPLAVVGTLAVWLGFLEASGWHRLGSPAQLVAFGGCLLGLVLILRAGFALNKPVAKGFLVSAACFFVDAFLIYATVPRWVNAGSGQDAVTLAALMGAGTSLFFGLALLIGAAMASLFAQK